MTAIVEPPELPLAPELPFTINADAFAALSPEEAVERLADIERLKEELERNRLYAFLPHEGEAGYKRRLGIPLLGSESRGQVEFLELMPRDVFLAAIVAGNRFGKTLVNVINAAIQTLPVELIPWWLLPYKVLDPEKRDVRCRFIGPDLANWLSKSLIPHLRFWLPPAALHGGSFDKAWKDKDRKLTFADGSWWDFLTHDMDLDAFSSVSLDMALFDEEPTGPTGERQYDETIRGVLDREGYVRFTLTPVEGIGWLHSELVDDDDQPRKDEEVHVVTGDIDHNPHISEKRKAVVLKRWERAGELLQRKSGLWVHAEGLIFPEFKRRIEAAPGSEADEKGFGGHLRLDRPLYAPGTPSPRDENGMWRVPVFESIDPGINVDHPFAFTVSFLNIPETDVYGVDDVLETFFAHKSPDYDVDIMCDLIYTVRATFAYRPAFTAIDPSAQNRNQETGRRLIDAFRKRGIYPVPGQNDRAITYAEVRGRLNARKWVIWKSLDPIIGDEMVNYRWKKQRGRIEDAPRPEPIKRNDDCIDTIRYKIVRIPVYQGQHKQPDEEDPDPLKALARRHLAKSRGRRRQAKVGGVW